MVVEDVPGTAEGIAKGQQAKPGGREMRRTKKSRHRGARAKSQEGRPRVRRPRGRTPEGKRRGLRQLTPCRYYIFKGLGDREKSLKCLVEDLKFFVGGGCKVGGMKGRNRSNL
jgi:hypothetical protein